MCKYSDFLKPSNIADLDPKSTVLSRQLHARNRRLAAGLMNQNLLSDRLHENLSHRIDPF
jgi:hypothetical protein